MKRIYILFILLQLILVPACKDSKENTPTSIEIQIFSNILYDLFYLNELYSQQPSNIKDSILEVHLEHLLSENNFTEGQFETMKKYYSEHTIEYQKLLETLKSRAEHNRFK